MQCVILAGGLATRMRPLTEKVPKALIEADGIPFIHYQLAWLSRHSFQNIVISIGYKGEMIQDYVGDGAKWNLRVRYVSEGMDLKGTGGALRLCFDQGALEEKFLVLYGDSFLPIDFHWVWQRFENTNAEALMTVLKNDGKWDKSNVLLKPNSQVIYDKWAESSLQVSMKHIDYGLLAFRRNVIAERVPKGQKVDLAVLLKELSQEGRLEGLEVSQRFYEIGSPSGLEDFQAWIKTHNSPHHQSGDRP